MEIYLHSTVCFQNMQSNKFSFTMGHSHCRQASVIKKLPAFYRNRMYFIVFTAHYHSVNHKSLLNFCLNFNIISPSTTRSPLRFSNRNFMNVSSLPHRYMPPSVSSSSHNKTEKNTHLFYHMRHCGTM